MENLVAFSFSASPRSLSALEFPVVGPSGGYEFRATLAVQTENPPLLGSDLSRSVHVFEKWLLARWLPGQSVMDVTLLIIFLCLPSFLSLRFFTRDPSAHLGFSRGVLLEARAFESGG